MPRTSKKAPEIAAPTARFELLSINGTQILVANYSLANREEVWDLTNQINEWLGQQKPNGANILFDVDRPYYEAKHVNHWKKSLGRNDVVIRKSCFINASPLMQMMVPTMRAFAALTGAPMKKDRGVFFKDRATALDWLSK